VGGEQFVKALDAAYVRVLHPGHRQAQDLPSLWDISRGAAGGGDVFEKYVTVFDCYPYVDLTEFPTMEEIKKTDGLLKCILDNEELHFGTFASSPDCVTSSSLGGPSSDAIFEAMVQELGDNYGKTIEIVVEEFSGGLLTASMFEPLMCDCVDMIDNVHALGAETSGQLRREIALHTCTIRASSHVFYVRTEDWANEKYRTVEDLVKDENAEICGGDLDNHVIRSLFGAERQFRAQCPRPSTAPVLTPFHDVETCIARLNNKESAAFFHWDPTLDVPGLTKIQTGIVGGTPYWVKP
jgi:hypothetical protein